MSSCKNTEKRKLGEFGYSSNYCSKRNTSTKNNVGITDDENLFQKVCCEYEATGDTLAPASILKQPNILYSSFQQSDCGGKNQYSFQLMCQDKNVVDTISSSCVNRNIKTFLPGPHDFIRKKIAGSYQTSYFLDPDKVCAKSSEMLIDVAKKHGFNIATLVSRNNSGKEKTKSKDKKDEGKSGKNKDTAKDGKDKAKDGKAKAKVEKSKSKDKAKEGNDKGKDVKDKSKVEKSKSKNKAKEGNDKGKDVKDKSKAKDGKDKKKDGKSNVKDETDKSKDKAKEGKDKGKAGKEKGNDGKDIGKDENDKKKDGKAKVKDEKDKSKDKAKEDGKDGQEKGNDGKDIGKDESEKKKNGKAKVKDEKDKSKDKANEGKDGKVKGEDGKDIEKDGKGVDKPGDEKEKEKGGKLSEPTRKDSKQDTKNKESVENKEKCKSKDSEEFKVKKDDNKLPVTKGSSKSKVTDKSKQKKDSKPDKKKTSEARKDDNKSSVSRSSSKSEVTDETKQKEDSKSEAKIDDNKSVVTKSSSKSEPTDKSKEKKDPKPSERKTSEINKDATKSSSKSEVTKDKSKQAKDLKTDKKETSDQTAVAKLEKEPEKNKTKDKKHAKTKEEEKPKKKDVGKFSEKEPLSKPEIIANKKEAKGEKLKEKVSKSDGKEMPKISEKSEKVKAPKSDSDRHHPSKTENKAEKKKRDSESSNSKGNAHDSKTDKKETSKPGMLCSTSKQKTGATRENDPEKNTTKDSKHPKTKEEKRSKKEEKKNSSNIKQEISSEGEVSPGLQQRRISVKDIVASLENVSQKKTKMDSKTEIKLQKINKIDKSHAAEKTIVANNLKSRYVESKTSIDRTKVAGARSGSIVGAWPPGNANIEKEAEKEKQLPGAKHLKTYTQGEQHEEQTTLLTKGTDNLIVDKLVQQIKQEQQPTPLTKDGGLYMQAQGEAQSLVKQQYSKAAGFQQMQSESQSFRDDDPNVSSNLTLDVEDDAQRDFFVKVEQAFQERLSCSAISLSPKNDNRLPNYSPIHDSSNYGGVFTFDDIGNNTELRSYEDGYDSCNSCQEMIPPHHYDDDHYARYESDYDHQGREYEHGDVYYDGYDSRLYNDAVPHPEYNETRTDYYDREQSQSPIYEHCSRRTPAYSPDSFSRSRSHSPRYYDESDDDSGNYSDHVSHGHSYHNLYHRGKRSYTRSPLHSSDSRVTLQACTRRVTPHDTDDRLSPTRRVTPHDIDDRLSPEPQVIKVKISTPGTRNARFENDESGDGKYNDTIFRSRSNSRRREPYLTEDTEKWNEDKINYRPTRSSICRRSDHSHCGPCQHCNDSFDVSSRDNENAVEMKERIENLLSFVYELVTTLCERVIDDALAWAIPAARKDGIEICVKCGNIFESRSMCSVSKSPDVIKCRCRLPKPVDLPTLLEQSRMFLKPLAQNVMTKLSMDLVEQINTANKDEAFTFLRKEISNLVDYELLKVASSSESDVGRLILEVSSNNYYTDTNIEVTS